MIRTIGFILFALVLEAIGVVYLSKGLKQVGGVERFSAGEILRVVKAGAANGNVLLGVALETAFFICLLILLSRRDVSFVWPLTALGFVLTTLAAKYVLHEQIPAVRWLGVVLIMIGAACITWSERQKKTGATTEAAAASGAR